MEMELEFQKGDFTSSDQRSRIVKLAEDGEVYLHELLEAVLQFFKTVKESSSTAHVKEEHGSHSSQLQLHKELYSKRFVLLQQTAVLLHKELQTLGDGQSAEKGQVNEELATRLQTLRKIAYEKNEKLRVLIEKLRQLQFDINTMSNLCNVNSPSATETPSSSTSDSKPLQQTTPLSGTTSSPLL